MIREPTLRACVQRRLRVDGWEHHAVVQSMMAGTCKVGTATTADSTAIASEDPRNDLYYSGDSHGEAGTPSLSSKKTPLRWMKRSWLCSATIVHSASCLGRPVSGRAMQYSNAVPIQPRFFCAPRTAGITVRL